MLVELRSLFGLLCAGEPLPEGSERECSAALADAPALSAALERAPSIDLVSGERLEQKPDYKPEPAPGPAPGAGFRR
jgi:hypothetical protein